MRGVLLRRVPLASLLTIALGVTLALVPVDRELVVRVYALVLGALALATMSAATAFAARRTRSPFAEALRRRPERQTRPEALERLERHVALGSQDAADFHFRLRPSLVEAADAAVWRRYGLPLERAEKLVSPELWEVVRPDLPPPEDRRAPGPPLSRIESLLDEIERIGP
jgi:hypothetical protein